MVRRLYLASLWAVSVLGMARVVEASVAVALCPEILVAVNPQQVPRWAPSLTALGLAVLAVPRSRAVFPGAVAALCGAGAWAFATPALIEIGWTGRSWWWLLAAALPLASWPVAVELRLGLRRAAEGLLALVALGAVGSLCTSPAAVHVAAAIIYPAALIVPVWVGRQIHRRSAA